MESVGPHARAGRAAALLPRVIRAANDAIIGALFPGITSAEIDRLAEEKEALFRERAAGKLFALDGARELIDWLDERDIPRAVVTSTPRENLDLVLRQLALEGRFQTLVASEDTERGKPDPQGYLLAAERLGVKPARCVVIEDAPAGIGAARVGGMRSIGVTTTRPADDLSAATLIVSTLADGKVLRFLET